jgi:sigma-B regulation protein RsbU (phosphoserine phosphatase)
MALDYAGSARFLADRLESILTGIAGQSAMAIENDRLMTEAAEQERLRQELAVAQRIQASFMPEYPPKIPGWELAAVWRSARQVGGDFYDFLTLPPLANAAGEQRVGLVIADVADKGIPAALLMALSRTLLRTVAMDGRRPAGAIARANELILSDTRPELFVTLFYAILEAQSGQLTYVNAGHVPPLLVRGSDGTTEELWTRGMALGVLSGLEFVEKQARVEAGDVLVLYTDGVTDACNAEMQRFGHDRLVATTKAHRTHSAMDLARRITASVADFVGDTPQSDDLTLVVAKRGAP